MHLLQDPYHFRKIPLYSELGSPIDQLDLDSNLKQISASPRALNHLGLCIVYIVLFIKIAFGLSLLVLGLGHSRLASLLGVLNETGRVEKLQAGGTPKLA